MKISKGNEDTQGQNDKRGEDNEGVVGDEDPDLASTHHDQRAGTRTATLRGILLVSIELYKF